MPTKLSTAIVFSSQQYLARLSNRVTVGELAAYLSHVETYLNTSTLEVAQPVGFSQRIQDMGLRGGDRLVIFMKSPHKAELTPPLQPGDVTLRLESEAFRAVSGGKRRLLVGKPDEAQQVIPDVDLRYVVPPRALEYISRTTLWLIYESTERRWYASNAGQTRVMLDEFELAETRVPLSNGARIRLYRGSDDPLDVTGRHLGELRVTLDYITEQNVTPVLEPGSQQIPLRLASERVNQLIRFSDDILLDQIVTSLARYNDLPLTPDVGLYMMRLVAPSTRIAGLNLIEGGFLYAPFHTPVSQNIFVLRDAHRVDRLFELAAGATDAEMIIGCRLQPNEAVPALDADLHDIFVDEGFPPHTLGMRSPFLARLTYRVQENTWWVRSVEGDAISMFVNTTRVVSIPTLITSGDVLTFGDDVTNYYARLEIEIRSMN